MLGKNTARVLIKSAFPLLLVLPPVCAHADDSLSYTTYKSGNADDVTKETLGGILLAGGGEDIDEAMQWLLDRGGRGDVVILRASGSDGYNQWLMDKGAHSVESIVFHTRSAAYSNYVISRVEKAEVIFLAGGDQSNYVNFWKGTPLSELINKKVKSGTPIGGTSAGLAVISEFVYSAQYESAQSVDVLKNPFHHDVTLENNLFHFSPLEGLITDSHFSARKRLGRLVTFMARLAVEGWNLFPHGIGVDEETAVAVEPNGDAKLFGVGAAYMITPKSAPVTCEPNKELTYTNLSIFKMGKDSRFNFRSFKGESGEESSLSIIGGILQSSSDLSEFTSDSN